MTDLASILVQSSVDGLFAVDRGQRYTVWNAAMERFAGKRADEVVGRNMFDVFPFLRDIGLDGALERALGGETVTHASALHALPGGEIHYFDRLYMPLRRSDGEVIGVVGVVQRAARSSRRR